MAQDPTDQTQKVIERLRSAGHEAHAARFEHPLRVQKVESGLLFALREACETVLTAIEAIDPVSQTMIEELRLEVEKRLRLSGEKS